MRKHDVSLKTGSTQGVVLSSEVNQATATSNMYKKFIEVWASGFFSDMREEDMQTDPQTHIHRHTDTMIAILRIPPDGDEKRCQK